MKSFSDKTLDIIFNHLANGYEELRQTHLKEPSAFKREKLHGDMMITLSVMNIITTITIERITIQLLTKQCFK